MNKFLFLSAIALTTFTSCEPSEIITNPDPTDSVYTKGTNLSFKTGGLTTSYSSRGAGAQCLDTSTFLTQWAIATGDNLTYNSADGYWEGGPNDTVVIVAWQSINGGNGTYNFTSPFDGMCYVSTPYWFRTYDPSLLTVNITNTTADSIFGNYYGSLLEIEFQVDSTGIPSFVYTGVVDSVSATFGVLKKNCY
jgi:hypothetical protein